MEKQRGVSVGGHPSLCAHPIPLLFPSLSALSSPGAQAGGEPAPASTHPQGDAGGAQSTVFLWSYLHAPPLFLRRWVEVEGLWAEATHCAPFSVCRSPIRCTRGSPSMTF